MSELSDDELTQQFQKFVGFKTGKSIHRVKGKKLVAYAKAIGDLNPKYVNVGKKEDGKPDYSKIVAHPAYPASFTVQTGGALYSLDTLKHDDGKQVITNMGKLLHTGQEYDYTGCVPIVHGMKLITEGEVSKIWVKNGMLWIQATLKSKSNDDLVCTTICTVGIRKGGWQ